MACGVMQSWKACQRLCNPQGSHGLNRRMFEFQPDKVHPELVARSKEMLLDIDVAKVQAVGPAAITFYVWVCTVLYVRLMRAVFSYLYNE